MQLKLRGVEERRTAHAALGVHDAVSEVDGECVGRGEVHAAWRALVRPRRRGRVLRSVVRVERGFVREKEAARPALI